MASSAAEALPEANSEQIARRERAIELSGWGRPFQLIQVHNAAFWLWLAGIAYGVWQVVHIFAPDTPVAGQALVVGVLVAAGYGSLLWLFFRSVDRYDRLPLGLRITGFLWGGLTATYVLALSGNDANISVLGKAFSPVFAHDWGAGISAPLVEESSKGIGFLLILTLAPKVIRSPRAALMTGAFIGLGFQILEDVLYSVNGAASGFFSDQAASVIHTALLRIATGMISHPAYAGLFAVGVLYLVGSPAVTRNVPRGIAFLLLSVAIHGTWDASSAIGDQNGPLVFGALIVSSLLAIIALRWAFRLSSPLEQGFMRDILHPEVSAGNVTAEEIDAAAGTRKTRKAFIKATHGHRGHKQTKHVIEATIDLAHEIAAADGADTHDVRHARSELVRLRSASPNGTVGAAATA